jgi:hypothetical protein
MKSLVICRQNGWPGLSPEFSILPLLTVASLPRFSAWSPKLTYAIDGSFSKCHSSGGPTRATHRSSTVQNDGFAVAISHPAEGMHRVSLIVFKAVRAS